MIAEFPQNWALQRFPVAKWLAGNIIIWYVHRHRRASRTHKYTRKPRHSRTKFQGRHRTTSHSLQQLCIPLCRPISLGFGRGLHRAFVSAHHVHVLYIPGAGCGDANHVVNRQREPGYKWLAVICDFAHSYRPLCIVAMAHA